MIDYLPLVIGFSAAVVGIWGKSWDDSRDGLHRITRKGWITLVLAGLSFGVALTTIRSKNSQLARVAEVRKVANAQLLEGLGFILRHLVVADLRKAASNDSIFRALQDTSYLAKVGDDKLINPDSTGLLFDGPNGGFVHPWELYDANIQYGKRMIDEAMTKFASVLDPATVVAAQTVVSDPFFRSKVALTPSKMYFELALTEYRDN